MMLWTTREKPGTFHILASLDTRLAMLGALGEGVSIHFATPGATPRQARHDAWEASTKITKCPGYYRKSSMQHATGEHPKEEGGCMVEFPPGRGRKGIMNAKQKASRTDFYEKHFC